MLIDNKFLLFGGKGGVGKTSCAAATSIYTASKGKKTLILSTDPAHSLSDSFGIEIGNKITKIKDNLDALEIDAKLLLKDYKEKYGDIIKQIAEEGTLFSREDIQQFFDLSLPGMDELVALIKIIDILEAKENRYDLLILDTAPTGHTIRLLELPELMTAYVKVLIEMREKHRVIISTLFRRYIKDKADEFIEKMNNDIERVKAILKSSETKFIPITIPEAMSIYETEKLVSILEEHQIPIEEILVNRVMSENCNFCKSKKLEQEKYIKEIKKKFKYKIKEIPLFANEIRGESLEVLAKILFEEAQEIPKPKVKIVIGKPKFESLKLTPNLEFLLFGGKGGVGKTSMASAVALHESKNKKVLIFSTDPAHSLSDSFGKKIGNSITKINNNLDALEIDSYALLNELKTQYRREIEEFFNSVLKSTASAGIDVPYDRKVTEDLFDLAPPGIDEIMALKTMIDLMQDKKYDLFILDTAPTGHTIRLLELPEIAESWVRVLLEVVRKYPVSFKINKTLIEMLGTIKKAREILAQPEKTEFVIVTIPEAMALEETQDLVESLKRLKVPIEYLIINMIIPKSRCGFCAAKRSEQLTCIKKLQELKLKAIGVELFDREIRGLEALEQLSKKLY